VVAPAAAVHAIVAVAEVPAGIVRERFVGARSAELTSCAGVLALGGETPVAVVTTTVK
jgi:hypothetical protein